MNPVFAIDTQVSIALGARHDIGAAAASIGHRAAIVAGRHWLRKVVELEASIASLAAAGVEVVVKAATNGEPDVESVMDLASELRDGGIDVVISVGGGSAIDLAKAASALCGARVDILDALAGERIDRRDGPGVIALPTTAGSGAEVSRGAIVLDRASGRKRGIRGRAIAPRVALVDPELMLTNSALGSGISGFDALSHAVETAVSKAASSFTIALSRFAFQSLLWSVPRTIAEPEDVEARLAAAQAATLMGMNLVNSTTCLPHRLQYPVGALTATPHGLGVSALMPAWIKRTYRTAPERLAALVGNGSSAEADAARVVDAVLAFRDEVHVDVTLSDLGVNPSDIPRLVELVEGSLDRDPGAIDRAALAELYSESL